VRNVEGKNKLDFQDIKDIGILSFGTFGLGFIFPAYSCSVPRILLNAGFSKTSTIFLINFELLFLIFLNPISEYVLNLTRSAIGRRTPYIITFGVLTSFMLALLQNINQERSGIGLILVILVILVNFCLYFYSLSLFGLIKDKSEQTDQTNQIILRLQTRLWSFIGTFFSLLYCGKSTHTVNSLLPGAGLVLLISSLLVAFFIVEDKKYKVKISPLEKGEYSFSYDALKTLKNLKQNSTRGNILTSLILGFFYYLDILIIPFVESKNLGFVIGVHLLASHLVGVSIGYLIKLFLQRGTSVEWKKSYDYFFLCLNALLYLFLYVSISFDYTITSYFLLFLIGTGWGFFLSSRICILLPGKAERTILYASDDKEKVMLISFWTIIISIILGVVTDIFGVNALFFIAIAMTILELIGIALSDKAKRDIDSAEKGSG